MFDAGKLRSVESSGTAGQGRLSRQVRLDSRRGQLRSVEIGRSISPVMTVCCG